MGAKAQPGSIVSGPQGIFISASTVTADITNVIVTGPAAFNGGSFRVIAF